MKLEVVPHTTQLCGSLFGPDDLESEDRYGDVASAQTISTYPTIPNCGRLGDPICDRFYIHVRIYFIQLIINSNSLFFSYMNKLQL